MLLTSKEAAHELKIHENTLRRSRITGVLLGNDAPPYIKIGSSVRYRQNELEQWVNTVQQQGN